MSYAVMIIGGLMIIGGVLFVFYIEELPPLFQMQGLLLGVMVASLGIVVIALGRINESISEQTDYLIEKMGTESKQAKKVNGKLVEDIDEYDDDDERKIKG
tara:strand:+ start:44 stop:346 length:303 start_codon:yes stop_codon:yes gene_type:complete